MAIQRSGAQRWRGTIILLLTVSHCRTGGNSSNECYVMYLMIFLWFITKMVFFLWDVSMINLWYTKKGRWGSHPKLTWRNGCWTPRPQTDWFSLWRSECTYGTTSNYQQMSSENQGNDVFFSKISSGWKQTQMLLEETRRDCRKNLGLKYESHPGSYPLGTRHALRFCERSGGIRTLDQEPPGLLVCLLENHPLSLMILRQNLSFFGQHLGMFQWHVLEFTRGYWSVAGWWFGCHEFYLPIWATDFIWLNRE